MRPRRTFSVGCAMAPLDIAIVIVYLVAIVGLGCWAGLLRQAEIRRCGSGQGIFSGWRNAEMARHRARTVRNQYLDGAPGGARRSWFQNRLVNGELRITGRLHADHTGDLLCPLLYSRPGGDVAGLSRKAVFPACRATLLRCSQYSPPSSSTLVSRSTQEPLSSMEFSVSNCRRRRMCIGNRTADEHLHHCWWFDSRRDYGIVSNARFTYRRHHDYTDRLVSCWRVARRRNKCS